MQASSAQGLTSARPPIPDHVPAELVREFDFRTGLGDHPHSMVAALHDGPPRVLFPPCITTRYRARAPGC